MICPGQAEGRELRQVASMVLCSHCSQVLGAGAGLGPQWRRSDGLADVFGGLSRGDVEGQVVDDG